MGHLFFIHLLAFSILHSTFLSTHLSSLLPVLEPSQSMELFTCLGTTDKYSCRQQNEVAMCFSRTLLSIPVFIFFSSHVTCVCRLVLYWVAADYCIDLQRNSISPSPLVNFPTCTIIAGQGVKRTVKTTMSNDPHLLRDQVVLFNHSLSLHATHHFLVDYGFPNSLRYISPVQTNRIALHFVTCAL